MNEVEKLCSVLFGITFGFQMLAVAVWILERKSPRINALLPKWTLGTVMLIGGLAAPCWVGLALELDGFPLAWVHGIQLAIVGKVDSGLTELGMWTAGVITLPFMAWLYEHRAPKATD